MHDPARLQVAQRNAAGELARACPRAGPVLQASLWQRHGAGRWEQFLAEAGRIDRIAKGRAPGDAWQALERLLLAVSERRALAMLG